MFLPKLEDPRGFGEILQAVFAQIAHLDIDELPCLLG